MVAVFTLTFSTIDCLNPGRFDGNAVHDRVERTYRKSARIRGFHSNGLIGAGVRHDDRGSRNYCA